VRRAARRWSAVVLASLASLIAYVLHERATRYGPFAQTLRRSLSTNDFAFAYANEADRAELRRTFAFLAREPDDEARVRALIAWIDRETLAEETWSIRATELARLRRGACEIHALAVGVLSAFDVRARWISGVKSSLGFGYLEAHVGGRWRLYRLRSGGEPALGVSAWELFQASEPSLNVRMFYPRPERRLTSWQGAMTVAVFPFANVTRHPELEALLRGTTGVPAAGLNPYDYYYGWAPDTDGPWVEEASTVAQFERIQSGLRHRRLRTVGALIDALAPLP
jgi:hypothetical protein